MFLASSQRNFPGIEVWELVEFSFMGIKKVRDGIKKYQKLHVNGNIGVWRMSLNNSSNINGKEVSCLV